jgi:hypothetical protein
MPMTRAWEEPYSWTRSAVGAPAFSEALSSTTRPLEAAYAGSAGTLKGTFYAGGGNPAAEMGGRFSISGTNYKAGGTFAAAP